MAVDERARHELYQQLAHVLGSPQADTLMGYLPPVGWADVVTIGGLHQAEERLDAKIDGVEERLTLRIAAVEERLDAKIDGVEERLTLRIDAVERRLDAKIDAVEARLDAKIDAVEERLTLRIDGVEERLDAKIDGVEERLTLRIDGLRDNLVATFREELAAQTRAIMFSSVGMSVGVGGLILAATRLA